MRNALEVDQILSHIYKTSAQKTRRA